MENILSKLEEQGLRLLGGAAVLIIGLIVSRWIIRLVKKSKKFNAIEPTLKGFLETCLKVILYLNVALSAIAALGIPLTSVLTLIASAGVAVSLAMQGALSNFVGGITILIFKPFRNGDFIKIGDTEGVVQRIGIFYTDLKTYDNRRISIPNSQLTNTAITNYTVEGTRRVDVVFSVSYLSDMDKVTEVLKSAVASTANILPDPEPTVRLTECGSSSLDFTVKVWCAAENYWSVKFDLLENGKRAIDKAGIEIPYPQLDVHMR